MRHAGKQRGGTLVEFAIVLPIFVSMMFIIFDFARALQTYHTMTNAAREGARFSVAPYYGSNELPSADAVQARVCDYMRPGAVFCGSGPDNATVTVSQSVTNTVNGVSTTFTEVDVTTPYRFKLLRFATITLATKAVMRNENNAIP
ncbi:MAG TPA: TadE/TadG family type IV pilus assembly protein [Clostridia bacterium]|nr:TadE/TadG family type IV pilus assembly protein [Clostridia bacterium]